MGQALYRKYRPKNFREVVGQEHVTATLANAIQTGRISHAYLFTGPRGVGKTSAARILARAVNGFSDDDAINHLDIIEIDAASNRRIDEIRELRERVNSAPTSGKYKVYIIDEVHMLTKEAFNALLKTLEEPPKHVIFILATTEAHKLPETIISRTQRFSFKPINNDDTVNHLRQIAQKEEISISDEALELIAEHGNGSFRDSTSLLDQASSLTDRIEIDQIRDLLGLAPTEMILALIKIVATGSPQQLFSELESVRKRGYQSAQVAKQISAVLRQQLIDGDAELDPNRTRKLLGELIEIPISLDPDTALEVVLLGLVLQNDQKETGPRLHNTVSAPILKPIRPKSLSKDLASKESSEPQTPADLWANVLQGVKQNHTTLYSALRMASAQKAEDTLTISFQFLFHKNRVQEAKNFEILQKIVKEFDDNITIQLDVAGKPNKPKSTPQIASIDHPIDAITNIFGGGEVLES